MTTEVEIKKEVKEFQDMETKLLVLQQSLSKNKEFQQFMKLQSAVNAKAAEVWADIESKMIEHGLVGKDHSIDADWVKLTIVEKPKVEVVGNVAPKFTKRVVDTKKINDFIKEMKKVPAGVQVSKTQYLRKTFRSVS